MTTEELMNLAYEHLDQDRVRYPPAEMILSGLNPAQDLIALLTRRLRHTHVYTLPRHSGYLNLLDLCPSAVRVERVVHGDQGADRLTPGFDQLNPLEPTTLEALSGTRPEWFQQTGVPKRYYLHGRMLMGIWPRPSEDCTLTLTLAVVPTPLSPHDTARASELREVDHELISDVAHCLLLVKEGAVELDKAFGRLALIMRHEAFNLSLARIRKQRREWPRSNSPQDPQTSVPAQAQ